jgi:tetratricopeptide (TPR) repeat protein
MRRQLAFGLMTALVCAAGAARAQPVGAATGSATTFSSSGGLADTCADLAMSGQTGVVAEQTCANALQTQALMPLDRAGTLVNLGVIRLRSGRFEQADDDFTTALRYMPDLPEAYVNRGAARIGLHRYRESVADLDKALQLGVKEPEKAYYDRALAYEWLENPRAAYADYKKALEIAPGWDLAREQMFRFSVTHAELTDTPQPPTAKP